MFFYLTEHALSNLTSSWRYKTMAELSNQRVKLIFHTESIGKIVFKTCWLILHDSYYMSCYIYNVMVTQWLRYNVIITSSLINKKNDSYHRGTILSYGGIWGHQHDSYKYNAISFNYIIVTWCEKVPNKLWKNIKRY